MRLYFTILFFVICKLCWSQQSLTVEHWEINNGLPSNRIEAITQDAAGFIYIKSQNSYYRFDGNSNIEDPDFSRFFTPPQLPIGVSFHAPDLNIRQEKWVTNVNQLINTDNNQLWGASEDGLIFYDPKAKTFQPHSIHSSLPDRRCTAISSSRNNTVWFAMYLNGIGFYHSKHKKYYTISNIDQFSGFTNGHKVFTQFMDIHIACLFFDSSDNLWIGTHNKGLYKIEFTDQRFQFFRFEYTQQGGLAHKDISCPLVVKNEDIWISTWGGGINIWNKNDLDKPRPDFDRIKMKFKSHAPRYGLRVFPIYEDAKENIWCGIADEGLYYLDHKNRNKRNYQFEALTSRNTSMPSTKIWAITSGLKDDIWCGTGKGLVNISAQRKLKTSFNQLPIPSIFKEKNVLSLYLQENKLWIGTNENGLFRWDLKSNKLQHFKSTTSLDLNDVLSISQSHDKIWFGGRKGLFYCHKDSLQFRSFSNNQQLPSQVIEAMLSDDFNNLWLGTSRGLAKVIPALSKVVTYNLPGGVMGNNFTQGASKSKEGYLYFGTRYGFYRFHPRMIDQKPSHSPLVFKQVSASGLNIDIDSLKNKPLQLAHRQNNIRIEYINLNYSSQPSSGFQVKLEGNDSEWQTTFDTHRNYNLLPPGNYEFKIRKADQSGLKSFQFEILPPWWQTWQAILGFILLTAAFFTAILVSNNKRIKQKEKKRQKEYFEQLRFRFFLNISHEIRTPLTLIKGAIDRLSEEEHSNSKELNRIKKNTNRLIRMVNEILQLKQLEKNEITVNINHFNLSDFLESTIDAFKLKDEKSQVSLHLPTQDIWLSSSRELIETILYNLLSNAIKYSPNNSPIDVTLLKLDDSIQIKVKDQGIGISAEDIQKIFDRFYQVDSSKGAGIGLSLVQELTQTLGGKIDVESELNQGSTFTLTLPNKQESPVNKPEITTNEHHLPVLLIVDDQAELRQFIKEIFQEQYWCIEALDGKHAWTLIEQEQPAFIISDVVMPNMTGIELCTKLRSNLETSHIPLILLTGKTDSSTQLQAVECNADDFISKPFDAHLLKRKVEKLIEQRLLLQQKYASNPTPENKELALPPIDQDFLDKVENLINQHLDDTEFGVEQLAVEIALSSSGLYRKMKSITGYTPVEFIRLYRLKQAAYLLKESSLTISEIADKTGFGTQKYFSRCFKNQFDLSPSAYRKD
ncbi:response regulator [Prolixibacteraceae bacterium JC049]|nr:response regulator [Prolixibacteraceae bacterium JC049]